MHLALPWYLRVSTELLSCFIGAKVQAESYTSSFLKVGKCRLNGLGDNLSAYALRRSDFFSMQPPLTVVFQNTGLCTRYDHEQVRILYSAAYGIWLSEPLS